MTRKSYFPSLRMLTLYQKPVAYSILILLLISGWSCQNTSATPGKKRKATIAQRFEKPTPPPVRRIPIPLPSADGKHRRIFR